VVAKAQSAKSDVAIALLKLAGIFLFLFPYAKSSARPVKGGRSGD
jgi:hypothetical protein